MESKINVLFFKDCAVVFMTMVILWVILSFVMIQVSCITPNIMIKTVILCAGIIAGIFSTASSLAVVIHLKRNQKELYLKEVSLEQSE